MDGRSFRRDLTSDVQHLNAGSLETLSRRFDHVLSHALLIVTKLKMKPEDCDAPSILDMRIKAYIILVASKHLPEPSHPDVSSRLIAHSFLVGGSKPQCRIGVSRKHAGTAVALETITSNEIGSSLCEVT